MTQNNSITLTRRIGNTVFKVNIFTKEGGADTMEDKILRLIQNEGLASPTDCGMMDMPQMNRQSERSA
ncbi:MAG: transposon-encoded TnpW family protein [Oscillospiraceae bacterium]|nr:transposon-encoded TnpW family protein [Oscillospiraceae bacterium]